MTDKRFEPRKAWGGLTGHIVGRCKYCKSYSLASCMIVGEDGVPYHQMCHDNHMREIADSTQNLKES